MATKTLSFTIQRISKNTAGTIMFVDGKDEHGNDVKLKAWPNDMPNKSWTVGEDVECQTEWRDGQSGYPGSDWVVSDPKPKEASRGQGGRGGPQSAAMLEANENNNASMLEANSRNNSQMSSGNRMNAAVGCYRMAVDLAIASGVKTIDVNQIDGWADQLAGGVLKLQARFLGGE